MREQGSADHPPGQGAVQCSRAQIPEPGHPDRRGQGQGGTGRVFCMDCDVCDRPPSEVRVRCQGVHEFGSSWLSFDKQEEAGDCLGQRRTPSRSLERFTDPRRGGSRAGVGLPSEEGGALKDAWFSAHSTPGPECGVAEGVKPRGVRPS